MFSGDRFDATDTKNHDVSINVKELGATECKVDNERTLTCLAGMYSLPQEIVDKLFGNEKFKTTEHQEYNPTDNSVHIAIGDVINWKGNEFTVLENKVSGAENVSGTKKEKEEAYDFQKMLKELMNFGDQQYYGSGLNEDKYGSLALEFLKSLGVDTDKDFIINDTKARKNSSGGIVEVDDNYMHMSSTIYNKEMEKYREWANKPLYS